MRKTILIAAFMVLSAIPLVLLAQAAPIAVDLMTATGLAELKAEWRYSDVRLMDVPPVTPGDNAGFAYDIEPHAGPAAFDDSAWPVIDPVTLGDRRGGGKISFGWYRIAVTMPSTAGGAGISGMKAFLNVTIDDYAEVWVNGELPRTVGKLSPNAIVGYNTSNRVLLSNEVKPGDRIQVAIFAINGPLSAVPANRVFMREAKVEFTR